MQTHLNKNADIVSSDDDEIDAEKALQTQLQRSQYFSIDNGEILIDFGGIENDANAQGSVNIIYNPPGTNMICSWDNLMNQTNANYRLQFGVIESKTKFVVKIDNKIGNDGVFQCVRNNLQGISPAQIVNSAGCIFLLDNKRNQYDQNPSLKNIENCIISQDSDLPLIVPDGYAVIKMRIHTTGQNADSQLCPILTRLGMGVLNGTFQQGGGSSGSGENQPNSDPNVISNSYKCPFKIGSKNFETKNCKGRAVKKFIVYFTKSKTPKLQSEFSHENVIYSMKMLFIRFAFLFVFQMKN